MALKNKMRFMKLIILVTFILSYSHCTGQNDSITVPFVSYWAKGDSYDFKVTKIKQQWKEDELAKNDSSSYLVNFEVIDSTETRYIIKWSYKTNLRGFNIPENLIDRFSKYQMTEVIYQTNELGEFLGIENWEEIASMMKGLFTDLIVLLSEEESTKKEELEKAMQPLIRIYESKEGIEQLVFKELYFFHFPFGLEYDINEPIEYEEQLPNMFGGKPIRGNAKLYFEEVDYENSYCIMIQEMELNPEDTKEIVLTLFKRMGLQDKEMKKAMKTAKFDITDYNRYEYYYYPGIPINIETNRESIIHMDKEKVKRIEKTIIELVD
ncbi:MAG: hypothetical protein Kapaf2KO_09940 [Candidatus Kapaibacteriales bacterium]